jgi:hypothetical protein
VNKGLLFKARATQDDVSAVCAVKRWGSPGVTCAASVKLPWQLWGAGGAGGASPRVGINLEIENVGTCSLPCSLFFFPFLRVSCVRSRVGTLCFELLLEFENGRGLMGGVTCVRIVQSFLKDESCIFSHSFLSCPPPPPPSPPSSCPSPSRPPVSPSPLGGVRYDRQDPSKREVGNKWRNVTKVCITL